MSHLLHLILGLLILLFVKSSIQSENSTTVTADVGSTRCERGKQFYDSNKLRCRRCPRCKKANNYLLYNLKFSNEFGALECFPCHCELGKKAYDPETKRCISCPCNINGIRNTSVDISVDEWYGAMKCYPCVCKPGFFKTALTHYQCVGCLDCQIQNKVEIRPCSPTNNAECGGCLEGYINLDGMICVRNKPSTTQEKDLETSLIPTVASLPSIVDDGSTVQKSQIITVVILIIVVFIAMVLIYLCYGYITRRSSPHSPIDVSNTTSGTTVSSQNSEKKYVNNNDGHNIASPNSATHPLLTTDNDMAPDTVEYSIQDQIGNNLPPRTYVIQFGDHNKVIFNTPSDDTSL